MKILFFSSYMATPHFQTELELMEKHLQQGDEVIQLICNGILPSCLGNKDHDPGICTDCISKRVKGVNLLSKGIRTVDVADYLPKGARDISTKSFATISELKQYYVDNFDVGYAVASSVIGYYTKANPDMNRIAGFVRTLLNTSLAVFKASKEILTVEAPDLVYIFNGRFALERAMLRACEAGRINFRTHDRGNGKDFYEWYDNALPHMAIRNPKLITNHWDQGGSDRESIAKQFYENKVNRLDKQWASRVTGQTFGKLPDSWSDHRKNIVIYSSSEYEFAAIGKEWETGLYDTVSQGIVKINAYLNDHPLPAQYKVYLRIHPHIQKHFHEEQELIAALGDKVNFEIISSKSDVCTYTLLFRADKVVTFGSTIGVEATFWGKPSILLGNTYYSELNCVYNAQSIPEMVSLICMEELKPKPLDDVLKFGYYCQSYGKPYELYKAHTLFLGTFKDHWLDTEKKTPVKSPFSPRVIASKLYSSIKKRLR